MVIYHVTTLKKLNKYLEHGYIQGPVRAWKHLHSAERFSKQTGRKIILRLKSNETFGPYEGHRGEAVISEVSYKLESL